MPVGVVAVHPYEPRWHRRPGDDCRCGPPAHQQPAHLRGQHGHPEPEFLLARGYIWLVCWWPRGSRSPPSALPAAKRFCSATFTLSRDAGGTGWFRIVAAPPRGPPRTQCGRPPSGSPPLRFARPSTATGRFRGIRSADSGAAWSPGASWTALASLPVPVHRDSGLNRHRRGT